MGSLVRSVALLLPVLLALSSPAGAASRRVPTLAPPDTVIDGPSPDILGLSGMAIARDGTGGLVYLKNVVGVAHVFVSPLLGGRFRAPVEVDGGLAGPSSQPVIAATSTGVVLVAFVNGAELYTVEEPGALTPWGAPVAQFAGASNPSLSMSPFGKAYLAFTANGAGGHDVRAAYFNHGQWALEASPLDANAADNAGTGTGRPQVATAGDGVGIVAWGENGHIYTRRIWATSPSIVYEQADPGSFSGWNEVSASQPAISTGGDSSYAEVVFRELLSSGGSQQSRVLGNRLHSSRYDHLTAVDGLTTPGSEGADQPRVAATEYGRGFVTAERQQSHNLFATAMNGNESAAGSSQINGSPPVSTPDAVPANAGTVSTLIAWQQNPGNDGGPEIHLRYAPDGADLGPEQVVSSSRLGPTNADLGLAAGGDLAGDAAVAWAQGTSGQTQIVAGQLFQAPGNFGPTVSFRYATSVNPVLSWSPASELWGAPQYTVKLDGVQIAQTTATRIRAPAPVRQGRHTWQVTASNQAGLRTVGRVARVFVDSVAPRVSLKVTGSRRVRSIVRIYVKYTDSPRGVPRSVSSGVKSVQVKWGDRAKAYIAHGASHAYKRHGTYVLTVIVRDHAGNRTVTTRKLRITTTGRTNGTGGRRHRHGAKR